MTTTATLLFKIAQRLRPVYYGTTTAAGTTTTLVDTVRNESSGYFNSGTLFFLSGNLADKSAAVTDWDWATKSFTFAAQSAAPGGGADYAVIDKKYKRADLVAGLNLALAELGPFPQVDETLTTVLDQERYTLPAGVYNVLRVQVATNDASPYDWQGPYRYWRERDGYLYFADNQLPQVASKVIRVYYEAPHSRVSADADTITDAVHPELLATLAAMHVARIRAGVAGVSDPEPEKLMQLLTPQYQLLQRQYPIRRMQKDARWPGEVSRLNF